MSDNKEIITVTFGDQYPNDNFKLLEINNEILQDLNLNGRLYIKGVDKGDEAILCTSDKTYIMKSAHTSNSMMLTRDYAILSLQQLHYEMIEIPPRLAALKSILLKRAIDSDTYDINSVGYHLSELESLVQASNQQLKQYMDSVLNVYYIENDKASLLSDRYHARIVDLILTEITINGWSYQSIPIDECVSKIEVKSKSLLDYIFKIYASKCQEDGYYKLNSDLICIFRGKQILCENKSMEMSKFMESWIDVLPIGFTPKFEQLSGIAITTTKSSKPFATYFNQEELTIVPKDRMTLMFKQNPKWTLPDMLPYIKPILPANEKSIETFILKFARATTAPGTKEKIYISRY
ncbi:hypothetical protein PPL_12236 [Heterostelium album PN500]|uniref:Sister chromatid cohesion protein DCC1 n=1 Tax=Heterostelium pallidum (strain ATCC 26659 / Pp 5 / PN500) TaxID=670386 RepID=D3BM28_HETP5|nr:hypothetical protein PPL_12236 [Heterostelium album PN500]EFA77629.1 hypothetical protein PPL_12236 [Heterostelium album PN500]|eukprot:XP_020429757.1 hypothetical protein PPL_12236 [Heterostelium album PN500]